MPQIPFAYGGADRRVGRFPAFVTRNLFAEVPSSDANSMALIGRHGLEDFASVGSGPIRCMFQRAGLFEGDALVLSGTTLYRVDTSGVATAFTGSVPGSGRVSIDAGTDSNGLSEARIATGSAIYVTAGLTVAAEAFPDSAGVVSVLFLRGFWIAVRTDTQVLYSRVPGDLVWDAITFTDAEYEPDKVVGLSRLGDTVLVHGESSMEPFALTGQAANPLAPYSGAAEDIGCRNRDTIVNVAGSVYAVGDDSSVYRFTPQAQVVSDFALSERIRLADAADLRAWGFRKDQHVFYVLSLGTETWIYDETTKLWATASSLGLDYWRAHLGTEVGGDVLAGDAVPNSGQLWRVTPEVLTDAGDEVERIATGFYQVAEGKVPCSNVVLMCARGHAPLTGQGSDPLVGMRWSDDEGNTWSDWLFRTLGAAGKYRDKARWNGLGSFGEPGRLFQWKVTDPTVVRFSKALMNVTTI